MAEERIGVGIIGANINYGWGTRAHLPALQALPEFELVAVATRRMETAHETAEAYSIPNAFDDATALAAHPDVDVVLVCVRVPGHHELTTAALEAGKHVFTEWPLGANLAEAMELRDLAIAKGVQHMVGLQARGAPGFVQLRELITDGFVGEVLTASMRSSSGGAAVRPAEFEWAVDAAKGANTLTITSGHALDALVFCLGEFESVSSTVSTQLKSVQAEATGERLDVTSPDTVLLSGTLASGAVVSADFRSVPTPAAGSGFSFDVHGSEGSLSLSSDGMAQIGAMILRGAQGDAEMAEIPPSAASRWVPDGLEGPPLNVAQLFRHLGEGIRAGTRVHPDFELAVRRHELIDAIQRASDSGERQRVG